MPVLVSMSISLDGFSAGPDVSVEHAMGVGGERLHEWLCAAPAGGTDQRMAAEVRARAGAAVIGRRMYDVGLQHWGDVPLPVPTFVVTHERRPEEAMTSASFTFVTGGVGDAVRRAVAAAGERDVLVMGGADTVRQALDAGLVDEVRLQVVPVLLGSGQPLFGGTDRIELDLVSAEPSPAVLHLVYRPRR